MKCLYCDKPLTPGPDYSHRVKESYECAPCQAVFVTFYPVAQNFTIAIKGDWAVTVNAD